jgi:type I restriction enzyme R subunit
VKRYTELRDSIRNASGGSLDLKPYEADMRHLIDTYVEAKEPRKISPFDDMPLLELIEKSGIDEALSALPAATKGNKDAVAEVIENNIRSKIIKEHLNDPAYYEKMSALLDEVIKLRKEKALAYEQYLKKIADLVSKVEAGHDEGAPEVLKRSAGLRAIYNNLPQLAAVDEGNNLREEPGPLSGPDPRLTLAVDIDEAVRRERHADWRDHPAREKVIKRALLALLDGDTDEVERVFRIVKQQREYW